MENQTEEKDMGIIELLHLPKDYVLKTENGTYKLLEDVEIRIDGEARKLTKIEVLARALENVGFSIVDYKSNYEFQEKLTGLVIAQLKD